MAEPDLTKVSPVVKQRFAEASELAEDNDDQIYFIDGMERALIGTMVNADGVRVAVYEKGLCLDCLMDDMTEEEAIDWFEYNTLRSLPYLHEHAPVIIERFEHDDGLWNQFMTDKL